MSSEIATWGMIRAKVPTFPAPASGRDNECLTKSEILSLGGGNVHVEGSYGDGECVMLDNVLLVIWEYTFSVAPASLYFGSTGGTKSVQVTSYKRKYFGSNYTGEQVDVGFSSSAPGNGFSSSGTSVTAGNNTTTSQRSGTVTFTQYESGKLGYVSCNQAAGTAETRYILNAYPDVIEFYGDNANQSYVTVESRSYYEINGHTVSESNVDYGLSRAGSDDSNLGATNYSIDFDVYSDDGRQRMLNVIATVSNDRINLSMTKYYVPSGAFYSGYYSFWINPKAGNATPLPITVHAEF